MCATFRQQWNVVANGAAVETPIPGVDGRGDVLIGPGRVLPCEPVRHLFSTRLHQRFPAVHRSVNSGDEAPASTCLPGPGHPFGMSGAIHVHPQMVSRRASDGLDGPTLLTCAFRDAVASRQRR